MDGLSDDGRDVLLFHAVEMSLRTFGVAYLTARTATQLLHFRKIGLFVVRKIRVHAEGRNRVSPNGDDAFVERCRDVHHARVGRYDRICALYHPYGSGQGQRSAYIIYRCGGLGHDGIGQGPIVLAANKDDVSGKAVAQFNQFVQRQLLGLELATSLTLC